MTPLRYMIGYPVWNKADMILWMIQGITQHFSPGRISVRFHFDLCSDDSVVVFETLESQFLRSKGFDSAGSGSTTSRREVGCHNDLLKIFMDSNADVLVVPQDDQRFNCDHLPMLDNLFESLPFIGLLGGRDGYERGYAQMKSSPFSVSASQKLSVGTWAECSFLNSGPVIYTRRLVEKVGLLDEDFYAFYVWDDYAARARSLGFKSAVLSMDMTHMKFGRLALSGFYKDTSIGARDLERMHSKWPFQW